MRSKATGELRRAICGWLFVDDTMRERYLASTAMIDSDNPLVMDFAHDTVGGCQDPIEQAVKLFYRVRDAIRYDPYVPFFLSKQCRASYVLRSGRGFCTGKASLLCALGRVVGIPSRVGFATVRNHLTTREFLEYWGTDLMVYHGFTEFYLDGKWVKATPAFNLELCQRHRVPLLEFNGRDDSVFHAYDLEKKRFMEYVEFHGSYDDIPVRTMIAAWEKVLGEDRFRKIIKAHEEAAGRPLGDFYQEEVWKS